ncbi:hypothetical protein HDU97_004846 [Phlyctochytrium planicorne]|nr:hypothetical protein HDU97_004846 [Phlyctochytrium planicorne]
MVVLAVKKGEELLFNYETTLPTKISDIIEAISDIQTLKVRLARLVQASAEVLKHGPVKVGYLDRSIKELEGDSDDEEDAGQGSSSGALQKRGSSAPKEDPRKGQLMSKEGRHFVFNPDPSGMRTGESPVPETASVIQETLENANKILDRAYHSTGKFLKLDEISEHIRLIGGALTIAYPMGLPADDPARIILEDKEDIDEIKEIIQPFEASLWWAGRELTPSKTLGEFVGKNEKTKIIVKYQRKNQGPPTREPPLDEMGQRNLMAYYYKKQEKDKVIQIAMSSEF